MRRAAPIKFDATSSSKLNLKVRLHDAAKLMRYATCYKIALCKRAYLYDMRLLHAVAGKLKLFNFLVFFFAWK